MLKYKNQKHHLLTLQNTFNMKTLFITILTIFLLNTKAQSQITFLGLDFNKAKFVGSEGFLDADKIQSVYLNTWNDVMITEAEKFNLSKLYKKEFSNNFDYVKNLNKQVDVKSAITNNEYTLSEEDAKQYITSSYQNSGTGKGVLYLVESFNKTTDQGNIFVVLLDMNSGKVQYIKKFSATAKGFGFRNFWLSTVYGVMKISSKEIKHENW